MAAYICTVDWLIGVLCQLYQYFSYIVAPYVQLLWLYRVINNNKCSVMMWFICKVHFKILKHYINIYNCWKILLRKDNNVTDIHKIVFIHTKKMNLHKTKLSCSMQTCFIKTWYLRIFNHYEYFLWQPHHLIYPCFKHYLNINRIQWYNWR